MKKPIIFILSILFVLSIVITGILGVKMGAGETITYVDKIQCTDLIVGSDSIAAEETDVLNTYKSTIDYKHDLKFALKYLVLPDNATYKEVKFLSGNEKWFNISKFGIVSFTETFAKIAENGSFKRLTLNATLRSTDGHAIEAFYKITVIFPPKGQFSL